MAKQPISFRFTEETMMMLGEICAKENVKQTTLIERLIRDYFYNKSLAGEVKELRQRIEALEANQAR